MSHLFRTAQRFPSFNYQGSTTPRTGRQDLIKNESMIQTFWTTTRHRYHSTPFYQQALLHNHYQLPPVARHTACHVSTPWFLFLSHPATTDTMRHVQALSSSHLLRPWATCLYLDSMARRVPHGRWRTSRSQRRHLFTGASQKPRSPDRKFTSSIPAAIAFAGLFTWWLYPTEEFNRLSETAKRVEDGKPVCDEDKDDEPRDRNGTSAAWSHFASAFETFSDAATIEWSALSDKIVDSILPEWSKMIPGYVRKLQREMSMAPGSLADEIWNEAHDPFIHPEIRHSASVRVSNQLCDEEKEFLARRKKVTRAALARFLGIDEHDIHPDDVPVIATCGSGGGLRALVAGSGSLLAADEDGLFDCVTYTAGVSGFCWLQALYFSTIGRRSLPRVVEHIKSRSNIHIAYPPVAFHSLISAPTNKYLLSGLVEKLRGDPRATFGLVDIYGLLLAARYLVPRGELGVCSRDFKLSSQREHIQYGQNPLPIYTAVRHEIPGLDNAGRPASDESAKKEGQKEAWFQWFEVTPYELFCEEFGAGIPTWAMGRKFYKGVDVSPEKGFHLPEIRMPFLMGVFGSAFCATLSHYYREIRPLVRSITGFGTLDGVISGRYYNDLSKVHPIDPGTVANFAHGMHGKLPPTVPPSIYDREYLELMDAGMSNNLPIYPLLRPGRNVDVLIAFDASADIKTDNWLAVADGYACQRKIKGWPIGIGWPKPDETPAQHVKQLEEAEAATTAEAHVKLQEAKQHQKAAEKAQDSQNKNNGKSAASQSAESSEANKFSPGKPGSGDLGYCTVWVGTMQESTTESPPPPSRALTDDEAATELSRPDAGLAVVYLPLLANPSRVPGINPGTTDFLSTWNFVYTPEQVDQVVELARANYDAGRGQIRETLRAVYLRKKKAREEREEAARKERARGMQMPAFQNGVHQSSTIEPPTCGSIL
ncbi:FabD/lysophospholipase-like protein [Sodiomyces alkalinus F11]|uniref:Lysophospholipase n=1 Tax=Sodiomyces alkalinus (strain CBS 110278 / VKM F-3762 / F11) TaxID=1314773 RepID=A0A3N2Q8F6_SODAK|nr:FabD/lysophospholipase-like protein [Sodiomyces alkalinus F11]ROT43042.1 FabD/lysophospholipase-like protein [Sodiomyces alkalinus F11]